MRVGSSAKPESHVEACGTLRTVRQPQRERLRTRLWLVAEILPSALGGIAADPTPEALAKAHRITENMSERVEVAAYSGPQRSPLSRLKRDPLLKRAVRVPIDRRIIVQHSGAELLFARH